MEMFIIRWLNLETIQMGIDNTFERAMSKASVWSTVTELRHNLDYNVASMRWPSIDRDAGDYFFIKITLRECATTIREIINGNIS